MLDKTTQIVWFLCCNTFCDFENYLSVVLIVLRRGCLRLICDVFVVKIPTVRDILNEIFVL